MRAFSIRPAELRRISTSLTVISNFAAGSYALFTAPSAAQTKRDPKTDAMGKLAVPIAVTVLRKCRRPCVCLFILASIHNDRELGLAGGTGIVPRASHSNPEGLRLDGPDEHPYTPDALLSEPNCPSSHSVLSRGGRVEMWRGGLGSAYLLPALSAAGASLSGPCSVSTSRTSKRTDPDSRR